MAKAAASTSKAIKAETGQKTRPKDAAKPPIEQASGLRTYVLDTSVLLSDPKALFRFKEQSVIIPIIVINELEKKRHDPEIGFFARQTLRYLDDMRRQHERLDFPIEVGEGGTLRVELNHIDQSVLPVGFQLGDNDSRILAVAFNLANEGLDKKH
jgi:PhoH-like ATPase